VYALVVGVPVLRFATRSLLRTLIVAHRLVWADLRASAAKPTALATVQLLVALAGFLAITMLAAALRHELPLAGTLAIVVLVIPYAGLWLLVSMRLPHRDAPWRCLIPGALAFGVGSELVHVATTFFIGPSAEAKQGTYGSLGVAAALLLGLFFLSRVIVATAVLNATLWERRSRSPEGPASPASGDAPPVITADAAAQHPT
jgi:uncharacterized BrkB/YihY/UPF0761 family membrane protein